MSGDYSTHTEADAGISAAFDAYDDRDLDRPSRADIEAEAEWFRHFKARVQQWAANVGTDEWTAERERRVLDVVHGALCDLCRRNEAETNGLCRWCLDELRDERGEE